MALHRCGHLAWWCTEMVRALICLMDVSKHPGLLALFQPLLQGRHLACRHTPELLFGDWSCIISRLRAFGGLHVCQISSCPEGGLCQNCTCVGVRVCRGQEGRRAGSPRRLLHCGVDTVRSPSLFPGLPQVVWRVEGIPAPTVTWSPLTSPFSSSPSLCRFVLPLEAAA